MKIIFNFLFKNWLFESVLLILLTLAFTVSIALVTDNFYTKSFAKKFLTPTNTLPGKLELANNNQTSQQNQNLPNSSQNQNNNTTSQTSQNQSQINPTQPTTPTQPAPTPNPTQPAVPPPPPPPAPSGCFVKVSGYLYNMQPIIGVSVTDQTSGTRHTHTTSSFQCGSFANPTDMTNIYLSKHSGLGCWQRIAAYIVTPPAPLDPTC